jgi:hypothetical protein
MMNPLGTRGELAHAFYSLLRDMWQGDLPYLTPVPFRVSLESWYHQVIVDVGLGIEIDMRTRSTVWRLGTTRRSRIPDFPLGRHTRRSEPNHRQTTI